MLLAPDLDMDGKRIGVFGNLWDGHGIDWIALRGYKSVVIILKGLSKGFKGAHTLSSAKSKQYRRRAMAIQTFISPTFQPTQTRRPGFSLLAVSP